MIGGERPDDAQLMCSICGAFDFVPEVGVEATTLVGHGRDVVTYLACLDCKALIEVIETRLGGISLYALGMLHLEIWKSTPEDCGRIADRVVEKIRTQFREDQIAERRRRFVVLDGGRMPDEKQSASVIRDDEVLR